MNLKRVADGLSSRYLKILAATSRGLPQHIQAAVALSLSGINPKRTDLDLVHKMAVNLWRDLDAYLAAREAGLGSQELIQAVVEGSDTERALYVHDRLKCFWDPLRVLADTLRNCDTDREEFDIQDVAAFKAEAAQVVLEILGDLAAYAETGLFSTILAHDRALQRHARKPRVQTFDPVAEIRRIMVINQLRALELGERVIRWGEHKGYDCLSLGPLEVPECYRLEGEPSMRAVRSFFDAAVYNPIKNKILMLLANLNLCPGSARIEVGYAYVEIEGSPHFYCIINSNEGFDIGRWHQILQAALRQGLLADTRDLKRETWAKLQGGAFRALTLAEITDVLTVLSFSSKLIGVVGNRATIHGGYGLHIARSCVTQLGGHFFPTIGPTGLEFHL